MTDETPKSRARRPRPVPPDDAAQAPAARPDDPDAALRRLESMGAPAAATSPPAQPDRLPPSPAVDSLGAPPPARSQRPMGSSRKTPKARPRPAASQSSRRIARVAAPVVFLVAVIVLLGIVINSGVMGGSDEPVVTPTAKATKATSGGAPKTTKKYVVKSGDSLSSIAERFNSSTSELQDLNPDLSGTTLVVGERIVVPAQ
jgi:nucleoid-associated protein YgaU